MGFAEDARSRDLTQGWCQRGATFAESRDRLNAEEAREVESEFMGVGNDEGIAARFLHAFSGLRPAVADDQSGTGRARDGAADIALTRDDGSVEIVEVTRSLDPRYQRSQSHTRKFEQAIERDYTGNVAWQLGLERGWEHSDMDEIASHVAAELNRLVASESIPASIVEVHPHVTAGVIGPMEPPRIVVMSANAGANNQKAPYLDELSGYLANDKTVARKLSKLERESRAMGAARVHLFIRMSSTGQHGGLLPTSPSFFTWGEFKPPSVLTDLWLEGGTGFVFHWTIESGWVFHAV